MQNEKCKMKNKEPLRGNNKGRIAARFFAFCILHLSAWFVICHSLKTRLIFTASR